MIYGWPRIIFLLRSYECNLEWNKDFCSRVRHADYKLRDVVKRIEDGTKSKFITLEKQICL
jgi:hypothetical protein